MFLKISQNSQENIFAGVYYIKKEIPTQVFSHEFCKSFKKTFLQNTSGRLILLK